MIQKLYNKYGPDMIRLRVKEVAEQKGFSMGRLQRDAGVSYNTVKEVLLLTSATRS